MAPRPKHLIATVKVNGTGEASTSGEEIAHSIVAHDLQRAMATSVRFQAVPASSIKSVL